MLWFSDASVTLLQYTILLSWVRGCCGLSAGQAGLAAVGTAVFFLSQLLRLL